MGRENIPFSFLLGSDYIKKLIPLTLVFIFVFSTTVQAQFNIGYFGTATSNPTSVLWADEVSRDDNWLTLSIYSCSSDWSVDWKTASNSTISTSSGTSEGLKGLSVPSGAKGFSISSSGGEVYAYAGTTSNPNSPDIGFQAGACNPPPTDGGGTDNSSTTIIQKDVTIIKETIINQVTIITNIYEEIKKQTTILNEMKSVLNQINTVLNQIKSEMQTSMSPPNWNVPDMSNKLEENKPNQPTESFQDNNTYFEDSGSAPEAPALPNAPEPKPWDGVTEPLPMEKEEEQIQDQEQTKDPAPDQQPENSKDPIPDKQPENSKDPIPDKQPENSKDPVPDKQPENSKDPVIGKDPIPNQQPEYGKDPIPNKTPENSRDPVPVPEAPMKQTEQDNTLRWESDNGVFIERPAP